MKYIFYILSFFYIDATGQTSIIVNINGSPLSQKNSGVEISIGFPVGTNNVFQFGPFTDSVNTSAGIYRVVGSDTTLVRTLWSKERYGPGTYVARWDSLLDNRSVAPTGNYFAKVLRSNLSYTWEGARIGNSSTALTGGSVHAARSPTCITVVGSNLYYGTGYQERQYAQYIVPLNNIGTRSRVIPSDSHTGQATYTVCSDGTYLYWGGELRETFIFATRVSDNTRVSFSSGTDIDAEAFANPGVPAGSFSYSAISVDETKFPGINVPSNKITGLAVQKTGNYLFVARNAINQLQVVDKKSGAFVRNITISGIYSIATDTSGLLWIGRTTGVVEKYTVNVSDGTITSTGLTLSGISSAAAIVVSPNNNTVAVVDDAISQQVVRGFSNLEGGGSSWTLGTAGGYFTNALVTDYKFLFNTPKGRLTNPSIAYAPDGSLWVQDGDNCRIQHYSTSRVYVDNISFMSGNLSVQADNADNTRLYVKDYMEFKLDYSKVLDNGANGSWKLYKNWAGAMPGGYDEEAQFFSSSIVTFGGRTFCMRRFGSSDQYHLFELTENGAARKTKYENFNAVTRLLPNGDKLVNSGYSSGSSSQYFFLALIGYDGDGDPVWSVQPYKTLSSPVMNDLDAYPQQFEVGQTKIYNYRAGKVINSTPTAEYHLAAWNTTTGNWSWKSAPGTNHTYQGEFPIKGEFDNGNFVLNAGSCLVMNGSNVIWTYKGEFWKSTQTNYFNHYHGPTGLFLGLFGTEKPDNDTESNPPGSDGNVTQNTLVQINTDKAYLLSGGEGVFAGIHKWRIDGLSSVSVQNCIFNSSLNYARPAENELMAGLAHGTLLTNGNGWILSHPNTPGVGLTDWFVEIGNYTASRYGIQDVSARYDKRAGTDNTRTITRGLGNSATLNNWKFSGKLNFQFNDEVSPDYSEGGFLELLDNTGKIIAQICQWGDNSGLVQFRGNYTAIRTASNNIQRNAIANRTQPFSIGDNNGTITFTYAGGLITTNSTFEIGADVTKPTTFRLRFTPGGRRKAIDVAELKLSNN